MKHQKIEYYPDHNLTYIFRILLKHAHNQLLYHGHRSAQFAKTEKFQPVPRTVPTTPKHSSEQVWEAGNHIGEKRC